MSCPYNLSAGSVSSSSTAPSTTLSILPYPNLLPVSSFLFLELQLPYLVPPPLYLLPVGSFLLLISQDR